MKFGALDKGPDPSRAYDMVFEDQIDFIQEEILTGRFDEGYKG